jgi:D-alanyl-D-alanine dipeptidase
MEVKVLSLGLRPCIVKGLRERRFLSHLRYHKGMIRRSIRALLVLLCFSFYSVALHAQTAGKAPDSSLLPGPKPPDAPAQWKRFVGIYEYTNNGRHKQTVVILERNQNAYMHHSAGPDEEIHFDLSLRHMFVGGGGYAIDEQPGTAPNFTYLMESYFRTDAGGNPARYYVKPKDSVSELRQKALAVKPPEETGPFRKPDLVELAPLDPTIHLDIRYAQSNNFLGTPVYTQARAFLQRPAAEALLRVLHKLQPLGYGLLIHDGYRPWYVTKIFWDATPPEDHNFVADPQKGSRHNRGCAVDLTLYDLTSGKPIEMPGLYDEMSPRSFPDFPGGTSLQRWHRDLLRRAMESEGFTVNEDEWWHFDYKDWKQYPILNVPFEKLE